MFVVNEIRNTETRKQDVTTLVFWLYYKVIRVLIIHLVSLFVCYEFRLPETEPRLGLTFILKFF